MPFAGPGLKAQQVPATSPLQKRNVKRFSLLPLPCCPEPPPSTAVPSRPGQGTVTTPFASYPPQNLTQSGTFWGHPGWLHTDAPSSPCQNLSGAGNPRVAGAPETPPASPQWSLHWAGCHLPSCAQLPSCAHLPRNHSFYLCLHCSKTPTPEGIVASSVPACSVSEDAPHQRMLPEKVTPIMACAGAPPGPGDPRWDPVRGCMACGSWGAADMV